MCFVELNFVLAGAALVCHSQYNINSTSKTENSLVAAQYMCAMLASC